MRLRPASLLIFLAGAVLGAEPPAGVPGAAAPAPASADDLYQAGKQLFDQFAPPEVKQQFEFPSQEQIDQFLARLQQALDTGNLEELAAYQDQAQALLLVLRNLPSGGDEADWLAARLQEIEEAKEIAGTAPSAPPPGPPRPGVPPPEQIPYYAAWLRRERGRAVPASAARLMPELGRSFAAEGVPSEVAWLAEVESSLNPTALSPSGARGLFQLKAATAHGLGLSTLLPDDRTDPDKSARAAARYLRRLRDKFGSWPLAFAAYNAGEGRVGRALALRGAHDFAGVAGALPAETRMYVPEVCAVIAARTGVAPDRIPDRPGG